MRESTLRRGLAILAEFGRLDESASGVLTVSRLAERLGMHRSQASRTLQVLCEEGLVDRADRGEGYRLGWRLYVLGHRSGNRRLVQKAEPVLSELVALVGERCYLAVLQGTNIVNVLSRSSGNAIEVAEWVGHSRPAYATSSGRVLLMNLDPEALYRLFGGDDLPPVGPRSPRTVADLSSRIAKVRRAGYAIADEEITEGVISVAVPVTLEAGRVVAALGFSAPRYRMRGTDLSNALAALRHSGHGLSEELSGAGDSGQHTAPTQLRNHSR